MASLVTGSPVMASLVTGCPAMASLVTGCPVGLLFISLNTVLLVCHGGGQAAVQDRVSGQISRKTSTAPPAHSAAPVVTLAPKGYYLSVNSSGLAALDSTMFFQTNLIPDPEFNTSDPVSDRFMYQWTNTADRQQEKTFGGLDSNISVIFSSQNVEAGEYLMTVAAYMIDDQYTIVAFQTLKFKLTQDLNGLLSVTQSLDYQRHPTVFSTKKLLVLTAAVHDLFLQSDVTFDYYWFNGEGILAQTKQPNCLTTVHTAANTSLASFICVRDKDPDKLQAHNLSHISLETNLGQTLHAVDDTLKDMMPASVSPCVASGMFEQQVTFKDPVHSCHVTRVDVDPKDRGINIKRSALVNITCMGSTPSTVCVLVTSHNSSVGPSHVCQPGPFIEELSHQLQVQLRSTGWNDVHFFVYNDVSRHQVVESFYGYDPDSVNVPALTIPLVFGAIGVVIIVMAGLYLVHSRKKPHVEVADFDFHPSLKSSQVYHRFQLARMADTIRSMFFRDRYATEHKHPLLRTPARHFGDTCSTEQFYESL